MKKGFYLVLILFLLPVLLQAQLYNFRNWSLEHGLPQAQVTDIIQDNKGQLWLATHGGVSRFNGISFQNYTSRNGLRGNHINCLFQDSKSRIWVGTSSTGIAQIKDEAISPIFEAALGINQIAEDKAGRIWFATDSGVYNYSNHTFALSDKFPVQAYKALIITPDGETWAGSTRQGLYLLRQGTLHHFTRQQGLPSNKITVLSSDPKGALWVGTEKGVARYREHLLHNIPLPAVIQAPAVTDLAHDQAGNSWIGFRNAGLLVYNGNTFTHLTSQSGLKTNKIASLTTDHEGNMWIGTNRHGIQQYKTPWFVHYFDFKELKEPKITALAKAPDGKLWLGTEEGQLSFGDQHHLDWLGSKPWPEGTVIYYIYPVRRQEAWVCTSNGVWFLSPTQQTYYGLQQGMPADEVYHCVTDTAGTTWFGTSEGVVKLHTGKIRKVSGPSTGKVYTLLQDSSKQIWLGTENGIFVIRDSTLATVPALAGFNPRDIKTIAEDKAGHLYFGGFNYGLLTLDSSRKTARLYTAKQGLPQESLLSLYADYSDNLWLCTSTTVLKIALEPLRQQNKLRFRTYGYHDGFRGIEVSRNAIIQTPDSALWFGTAKGLTRYHHSLDRQNKVYPHAFLTGIQLFIQPTDWEELGFATDSATGLPVNPSLAHDQNHITFNYQGICLTLPEKVRYKYRLSGYNDKWSGETKQPFITFANLSPGSYTFELLARNNDGYWTPKPLTYSFSVMPPIWQREWFLGLLLVLVTAVVVSVVRLREKSLVKLNLLLEQKVRHRTQLLEQKNREKETLLKEVHHRVKNNLQIVISLLNQQVRHTSSPEATDVMRAVRNRVRSMALLHERLYQHSDLAQIDLNSYFTQICESLYSSFGVSQDHIRLEMAVPHIKVDIDSAITLGLIVNELISNALKYAFPDGNAGQIQLTMESSDNFSYTLVISDSGPGFPEGQHHQQHSCFGLRLVESLIQKLNGTVTYKNNTGTVAILSFNLPS